jgi:hypothetical protein
MIGFAVMLISFLAGLGTWFLGIRPYLAKRGVTVITGTSWGMSAWSDWQQCREFARRTRDWKGSMLATMFILAQALFVIGVIALLFSV